MVSDGDGSATNPSPGSSPRHNARPSASNCVNIILAKVHWLQMHRLVRMKREVLRPNEENNYHSFWTLCVINFSFSIAKCIMLFSLHKCRVHGKCIYSYYYTALFISHLAFSMSGSWQWIMLPTCPQWFLLSCDIESRETCLYMETASVNPCSIL